MRRYRHRGRRRGEPVPLFLILDEGSLIGAAIAGLFRAVYRYRSELAPLVAAGVVWLSGVWLHAWHPNWWLPVGLLAAWTAAGVVLLPRRWRWLRRFAWLDRAEERAYLAVIAILAGGWLSAACALSPRRPPLPFLWFLGTIVCAIPWWVHHRRRAKARIVRTMAGWPELAETFGLAGSRIMSAIGDTWGWTARIGLRRGQTVQQATDAIPAIESALQTRPGAVRIEPEPSRSDQLILRVIDRDPHAQPIAWPGVAIASVAQPVPLGVFEDGTVVRVLLLRRNTLLGGLTGYGKSGIVNVILAALVACRDVVLWGIDLKGGMELGAWRPCLDRLATTPEQAVELMADAVAELDHRTDIQTDRGQRLWMPSPAAPALLVVVDEYAELPEVAATYADSLARRGRAVAVHLLAATQRPTQAAMGHGAVRSQMDVRICLRVRERRDVDLILGQGMLAAGWRAQLLDAPGKFLISAPEHPHPRRARAYLLTDDDVAAVVTANQHGRPRLPHRHGPTPERGHDAPPRPIYIPRQRQPGPDEILWTALQDAPDQGVSIGELIEATQRTARGCTAGWPNTPRPDGSSRPIAGSGGQRKPRNSNPT